MEIVELLPTEARCALTRAQQDMDLQARLQQRLAARSAVPQASAAAKDSSLGLSLGGAGGGGAATKSQSGGVLRATLGRTRPSAASASRGAAAKTQTLSGGAASGGGRASPLKTLVHRGRVAKKAARAAAPSKAAELPPQPPSAASKRAGSPSALDEDAEDAATFLGSVGMTKKGLSAMESGNFKYLRRVPGRQLYNLELVAQHEIDRADYLTLSRAGVTHFMLADSTFTPFAVWEREYFIFHQIRKIRFFHIYRQWKSFFQWKTNVAKFRFNTAKRKLSTTLFSMNPDLRSSMSELFTMCCDAAEHNVFDIEDGTVYTIQSFAEAQKLKRMEETQWLKEFNTNIRSTVRKACDNVLDVFLRENNMSADNKMSFMERAALRNFCRWLTKFIRLADLLVSDTLLSLAQTSLADLIGKFKHKLHNCPTKTLATSDDIVLDRETADPMNRPLFSFAVTFTESSTDLQMKPTPDDFMTQLLNVLRKGTECVIGSERIIAHESLLPYTQTALAEQEVEEQYTMMHGDQMGKESFGEDEGAGKGGDAILSRPVLALSIGPVLEKIACEIRDAMKEGFALVDVYNHHFDECVFLFVSFSFSSISPTRRRPPSTLSCAPPLRVRTTR